MPLIRSFCSDSVSSVGSVGTEDTGEGIRRWLGVPRGGGAGSRGAGGSGGGGSLYGGQSGRQSVADTMSTYSFRSDQ